MLLNRRQVVCEMVASGVLTSGLLYGCQPHGKTAGAFPAKDINFLIPSAPGGGFDAYVRAAVPALEARFKGAARVIPQNVDGAGGVKAVNQLYRARPDGYTIAILNMPGLLLVGQQDGALGFDLERLTWICSMGTDPFALIVPYDSPVKSIAELRELSRRRPVKFTSVSPASSAYPATWIASSMLGIRAEIITGYRGTNDYIVATLRGDGDAAVASITALTQFRAGNLIRVLASFENHSSISGAEDATTLNLPELTQNVQLRPVAGPPHLPADLVDVLAGSIMEAMKDPKLVAWANAAGANLDAKGPEQTLLALRQQKQFIDKWRDAPKPV